MRLIDADKLMEELTEHLNINEDAYPNKELPLYTINTKIREQKTVETVDINQLSTILGNLIVQFRVVYFGSDICDLAAKRQLIGKDFIYYNYLVNTISEIRTKLFE